MKTILVVGLGNPGKKYKNTRHNTGIRVLESWVGHAQDSLTPTKDWKDSENVNARIASVSLPEARVVCLFPLTYMNNSGKAVLEAMRQLSTTAENMILIHDEIELPFGVVETKAEGSAHGHNGVRSVHQELGTQKIMRLRIGVGRPEDAMAVSDYVLREFTESENSGMNATIIPEAVTKLTALIGGLLVA